MKLNLNQIKDITCGAVRIEQTENGIQFFRLTKWQELYYKNTSADFYSTSFTTAGIKLCFETDADEIKLEFLIQAMRTRTYFCIDILENGVLVGDIRNFSDEVFNQTHFLNGEYPVGSFAKSVKLNKGVKTVEVFFPWVVKALLNNLELTNATFVKGVKRDKKMLVLGDSITQGYDSLRPSNRHMAQLSNFLGAEEYCKAIAGEQFVPEMVCEKEEFKPNYIFVSYGTNDWRHGSSKQSVSERCENLFKNLRANYKDAIIFTQTPIWRNDLADITDVGEFSFISELIKGVAKKYGVICFDAFNYVPADCEQFSDAYLHPNHFGLEHYAKNLILDVKRELKL